MQTDTNMKTAPKIRRTKSPIDADFFGPCEPSLPSLRHPEHFERYKETFLKNADPKRFSGRRNGEDGWFPSRGKQTVDGQVIKRWDRPLSSSGKELDAHLAGLREDGSLSWMGVFGGKYTYHYNADVDNHESKKKGYYNSRGRWVQVADLSVKYLKLVKAAYEALARLDRPTVIATSSRSLGLNIWQHTDRPFLGTEVFQKMTAYLEERRVNHHLNHLFPDPAGKWRKMEVFPMYGEAGTSNRLQRLPFGYGSMTLTPSGVIRPWHDQLEHFLRPGPIPSFEKVVDHLLALYIEQFRSWLLSGSHPAERELAHYDRRLGEVEMWAKAGCPAEEPPERKPPVPVAKDEPGPRPSPVAFTFAPETQPSPGWISLPRERRVYHLATHGLPDKRSLNRALYMLAVHLMGLELFGRADAGQIAQNVLEVWCLTKNNGMSRRLDGISLGPEVMRIIAWAIAKASKAVGVEDWRRLREKKYVKPLRVRWLVCGQGPANLYSPSPPDPNPSVIYCVSDSMVRGTAALKINRLPPACLEAIKRLAGRKPRKAVEFIVMIANYIDARGGKATVNRKGCMKAFMGYDNPNQWEKYMTIGEEASIYRLSRKSQKGVRSNEYELMIELEDGDKIV